MGADVGVFSASFAARPPAGPLPSPPLRTLPPLTFSGQPRVFRYSPSATEAPPRRGRACPVVSVGGESRSVGAGRHLSLEAPKPPSGEGSSPQPPLGATGGRPKSWSHLVSSQERGPERLGALVLCALLQKSLRPGGAALCCGVWDSTRGHQTPYCHTRLRDTP